MEDRLEKPGLLFLNFLGLLTADRRRLPIPLKQTLGRAFDRDWMVPGIRVHPYRATRVFDFDPSALASSAHPKRLSPLKGQLRCVGKATKSGSEMTKI